MCRQIDPDWHHEGWNFGTTVHRSTKPRCWHFIVHPVVQKFISPAWSQHPGPFSLPLSNCALASLHPQTFLIPLLSISAWYFNPASIRLWLFLADCSLKRSYISVCLSLWSSFFSAFISEMSCEPVVSPPNREQTSVMINSSDFLLPRTIPLPGSTWGPGQHVSDFISQNVPWKEFVH